MKRIFIILSFAALAAACVKESAEPTEVGDDVCFMTQTPCVTKVAYSEDADVVHLSWVKDDAVGLYSVCDSPMASNCKYLADASAGATAFHFAGRANRIRWESETEAHDFYAYYPYNAAAGNDFSAVMVDVPAVQKQDGADNMDHVAAYDFMWSSSKGRVKSDEPVSFVFHHKFAVMDLALNTKGKILIEKVIFRVMGKEDAVVGFTGGKFDLDEGILDLSSAHTSSSVAVDCGFTSAVGGVKHIYAVINPGHEGETFQIALVVKGEEKVIYEKAVPQGGFPAGKYISVSASYEPKESECVEIKNLSELESSNCYVVTQADKSYRFKADVMGNGYIPSELGSAVPSASIAPQSVLVLWYNTVQTNNNWVDACPIDMTSLGLSDGYIYFDTPKTFVNGNMVIAAFKEKGVTYDNITIDESGTINNATILWSWHIWAVENMDLEAEALKLTYTADDQSKTEFTVMDRNLGALLNGKQLTDGDKSKGFAAAATLGNCYQWGRKDPFPQVADYGNYWPARYSEKIICTPTYTPIKALQRTATGGNNTPKRQLFVADYTKNNNGGGGTAIEGCLHKFDNSTVTFAQAINMAAQYPYKFFKGAACHSYDKHWFPNNPESDPWKYIWGDYDFNDGIAIKKTIYDPCPAGWTLWQEETINAFVQNGSATATVAPLSYGVNASHGLMVAGSYFGYNGGGRQQDMSFAYNSPFKVCAYACPIALTSGTASDRYNHKILRNVVWKSPSNAADSKISVAVSDLKNSNPQPAQGYTVRCIKHN